MRPINSLCAVLTVLGLGMSTGADAVTPVNEPFCEVSQTTDVKNCEFRTMQQCQAALKHKTDGGSCVANPDAPSR
jgi:hypothetical protein